ncbi:MAG: FapA family protein, partial [Oscillospiraceae bacterium]|nr:FapA family protein [Oscillospiraceae bacterium]
ITVDKIMKALEENYISYGILDSEINDAVENRRYDENICVAKWDPPVDGVDGSIKYFYKIDSNLAPVENEHGVVDFKNLGVVRNITAGTTIAALTLPTEGQPGKDITGKVIPQKKGVAVTVNVGKGTSLINDGKEIIAAVDGNLVYKNGAFMVDEMLVIDGDVDVASGNIDFIGAVTVKGSVFEGFRVTSKRNITINGSANGAEIVADGDISIKIGAINCNIESKGSIKLGFCENCKIHAVGNIESASFVGGEVFAEEKILATGKGVMMGGKYTALDGIEASVIGSEKYVKTEITLGNNAVLNKERAELEKEIESMEDKADQLGKILLTLGELAKKAKLPPEREQLKT